MDLTTIRDISRPTTRAGLPPFGPGDAWLAGGTWLFSEPQSLLSRLIDLAGLGWTPLTLSDAGIEIAATCRIAELYPFVAPEIWRAAPLFRQCCDALLASFKIWNMATVGGNLCLALPAGALIALTAALDGDCVIWQADGEERRVKVTAFVTGNNRSVLEPGEVLRAIVLPVAALLRRTAFRQASHSHLGRSSVLLIGTRSPSDGSFAVTITAATTRPVRLDFPALPDDAELRARLDAVVAPSLYFDDAHGTAAYRRHMTHHFAEEIRQELAGEADACHSR